MRRLIRLSSLAIAVNGTSERALEWLEGNTFRIQGSNSLITFKPGELRFDQGGGYYILKKQ